jgi:hypothetical protein
MKSDPSIKPRPKGRGAQPRRAVGIVAAGAVLFPLLGAIPAATAATPTAGGALAPAALAGLLPMKLPAGPTGVGPVDPDNGYPYWYGDAGLPEQGLEPVRLELCVDIAECPAAAPETPEEAGYDTSQPLTIPGNFPEEAFWWSAEASMDLPGGATARLIMAQEAAFGGDGSVAAGQQNAFSRIRIRIDDAVPGATYTVTHPYGVDEVTADDSGRVRFTEDIGCLQQPCTWDEPTEGRIGPFLRWSGTDAPEGTIGDPDIPHTVVGSPEGTNFFRITGPNSTGAEVTNRTNLFSVMGQIATVKAYVDKPGGVYNQSQDIRIQASLPQDAKIVWTTDGTDPTVDEEGNVTNGEVFTPAAGEIDPAATVTLTSPGTVTLKFIAVDMATNETTQVYTEEYELDPTSPWVEATPAATVPLAGPQTVTLTGSIPTGETPTGETPTGETPTGETPTGETPTGEIPTVYYTTDGSVPQYTEDGPTGSTQEYTGPLTVHSSTTFRVVAVDSEGNAGEIRTLPYKIHNLQSVGELGEHGFPVTLTDNGWEGQEPVTLDLCIDDPLCPIVEALPNPDQPVSFPDNFPGEAFWWAAEAEMNIGGEDVQLTLASEAAFAVDEVKEGDQIAFGRIRVRGDEVFQPGATYLVTHPYGTLRLVADADGNINYTEDMGAMNANGNFDSLLEAKIGPFLRWDEGAPAGYLGDAETPHTVVGSPYDTNYFKIEQITDTAGEPLGSPELLGQTDQFVVQGREEFFDDARGVMWEDQIRWGVENAITTGFADGTFRPSANTNRDAMAAFLYRLAGEPAFTPPEVSPFVDYGPNDKFYKEVTWLEEQKITYGWTDKEADTTVEYRPYADITRDAMAAFLYRFASMEGDAIVGPPADYVAPAESPFVDYGTGEKFFKEVAWLAQQGVSTGWEVKGPDGTVAEYRALEPINRDATMVFMWRLDGQAAATTQ